MIRYETNLGGGKADKYQRQLSMTCQLGVAVLVLLFGVCRAVHAQAVPPKTVLVLYDGGREFTSIQLVDRGIESSLNAGLPNQVTIFREYMDLTRVNAPGYEQTLRDFYRAKYAANKPDLIVAIRGRPLDFILKPGDELFGDSPIVSTGMDTRQIFARKLPGRVTGTSLSVQYWPTVEFALQLQPETDQVAVVLGASPNDQALEALVRQEFSEHASRLKFLYLGGLAMPDLLQKVSLLPSHTVILFVSFARGADGQSYLPNDAVTRVTQVANVPTYINSDDVLDCGAVGGNLISFEKLGRTTADLSLRMLRGKNSAQIRFQDATQRARTVDARQLERWSIPLSRVPSESIILNRTPSAWELYHWQLIGGMSLIVLQSVLIAMLLIHRKRRHIAEKNLRISEVARRDAVLEERNRMAHDMHDTLAQGFTGVIVQLEAAKLAFINGSSVEGEEHNRRAGELARQSLGEARRSIRALRPKALQDGSLSIAMESLTKQMTTGTPFEAEFRIQGVAQALPAPHEDALLRIYQELLTNAMKHSNASLIRGTLFFECAEVGLLVQDDGIGFDVFQIHDGLGLLGIKERVNHLNGKLTVESKRGGGTMVRINLPMQVDAKGIQSGGDHG